MNLDSFCALLQNSIILVPVCETSRPVYFYSRHALACASALFVMLLIYLFSLLPINKLLSIVSYLFLYTPAQLTTQDKL